MEPSLSPASQNAVPASLSASRKQLKQLLLERGEGRDFFETKVEAQFQCLTFTNALILSALAKDQETQELRQRLCKRLELELVPLGTANYHLRSVPGATTSPYPDDLDDTFCVLSAIFLHDQHRLGGEKLAQATLALTATEAEPGGPYRTWVVSPDAPLIWRDIDPVVNANIAYFLKLNGIRLPKLDAYLNDQISLPASPYYPSPLHVLYFLTRALEGTASVKRLEDALLACQPTSVLEQALLITSLQRCGATGIADNLAPAFLNELKAGHGLDPLPICVDTISGETKHYAACAELTAALCLEALTLLEEATTAPAITKTLPDPSPAIIEAARLALGTPDNVNLQALTDNFLTKLTRISKVRELTTLPLDFAEAWNKQTATLPAQTLQSLSLAHLLGWAAYTLYDDQLDGDGTPALLSIANIASRQMHTLFNQLRLDEDYQKFFSSILNGMDKANAWELLHARMPVARLPDYSHPRTLYARSLGIMLSPVAVLRLAGYQQSSPEVMAVIRFFEHYLAAKQLNDDAHDWQQDLTRGHITAVVSQILTTHGRPYKEGDLPELQSLFWRQTIQTVCAQITDHVTRAQAAVVAFGEINQPKFFSSLIEPLKVSVKTALQEREQSLAFLATFGDKQ